MNNNLKEYLLITSIAVLIAGVVFTHNYIRIENQKKIEQEKKVLAESLIDLESINLDNVIIPED